MNGQYYKTKVFFEKSTVFSIEKSTVFSIEKSTFQPKQRRIKKNVVF
jgi:hypothetical protein